jgi:hypothetical protein
VDSLGWRDDMNFRRYPFLPARALSALWAIGLMHGSTAAYARQQLSPLSKPSEYKDLEDMTAGSLFPDELEAALAILSDGYVAVIFENPDAVPTCSKKLRPKVAELQKVLRASPWMAKAIKENLKRNPASNGFNVDHWRARSEAFVTNTNEFMRRYRVLCVTTDKASEIRRGCSRGGHRRRQGAFARSTCTCRSMFTRARHSPG